jgi:integrase
MHTSVLQHEGAVLGAASTASTASAMTLGKLIADYCAAYEGRDRTRPPILRYWAALYGERAFASLTNDEVFAGLKKVREEPRRVYGGRDADGRAVYRLGGKRKPATVNRYHAALMALLTWAIKQRLAPKGWTNPALEVERPKEDNARLRFLSSDEREQLLGACRRSAWPRLYLLILMAITTGARRGELLSLTWGAIDLERRRALIETSKNGEPRTLVLLPVVVAELRRFACDRGDVRVFPARGAKGLFQPRNFETSWQKALKAAGLRRFRFHDLRHTTASYLAQDGASLLEIADVLGHRSLAMTRRYSHLTVATKEKLINRVLGEIK